LQQRELIRTAFAPAMNGILLCSFLLLLLSIVGIIYARRKGTMWHERMPIVGFESINTGSLEGKLYQFAALFGFSMIPALGLVKYWSTLSLARVVTTAETPQVLPSIWSWSGLTSFEDPARICLMLPFLRSEQFHVFARSRTDDAGGLDRYRAWCNCGSLGRLVPQAS
jgi:hypothetical protein